MTLYIGSLDQYYYSKSKQLFYNEILFIFKINISLVCDQDIS